MYLIAASGKEEGGQHVHGWENITLVEEEVASTKCQSNFFLILYSQELSVRDIGLLFVGYPQENMNYTLIVRVSLEKSREWHTIV
jgi:hypothetical protein